MIVSHRLAYLAHEIVSQSLVCPGELKQSDGMRPFEYLKAHRSQFSLG